MQQDFSEETLINGKKEKEEEKEYSCYLSSKDYQKIPIDCSDFKIGRSKDCNLAINDNKVSRIHCRILKVGDNFILEDLGSANGTKVNGNYIKKIILKDGDEIILSNFTSFYFHFKK